MTRIIGSLAEVSANYDALFVDLWGCVHDGIRPIPGAVEALQTYRQGGGKVVLVTNSPRPRESVADQIDQIGVARDAWDTIATSGDSARVALYDGAIGDKVWHLGPDDFTGFFDAPKILEAPRPIRCVSLEEAEGIACTGPFDPHADPSVLRPQLLAAKTRGLKLLCANPDIVVDRGEVREWCAGAVAKLYTEMGGESLYFGKPHPPIYDLARRRLAQLADVPDGRILCIGDGPATDARGAQGEDLDYIFLSGGLGAQETETKIGGDPNPEKLAPYLVTQQLDPTFVLRALQKGADAVLIMGCHPGQCHYQEGNYKAIRRFALLRRTLRQMGLEDERVQLHWASAAEGVKFAETVARVTEEIKALGPLDWGHNLTSEDPYEVEEEAHG
jgi:HAD superfamily hydrolase (TIGR01459 family)